jgi:hypothetical protein
MIRLQKTKSYSAALLKIFSRIIAWPSALSLCTGWCSLWQLKKRLL